MVLTYHSVGTRPIDPFRQAVERETLERQLRILQARTTVLPLAVLIDRLRSSHDDGVLSAVSFDDGYADNASEALPVLEKLGVPATLFITTQPLRDRRAFWWERLAATVMLTRATEIGADLTGAGVWPLGSDHDRQASLARLHRKLRALPMAAREECLNRLERRLPPPGDALRAGRPLSISELEHLAKHPLIQIGSHTVSHPSLAEVPPDEQRQELGASRVELEQLVRRPVRLLAYPFGKPENVSRETQRLAAEAGYVAAVTSMPLPVDANVEVMAIPRLTVHEWTDAEFTHRLGLLLSRV